MSKKYLKNENGLVRAVTTEVLELEKPLVNEFYDINVFNRNMDKIEKAIKNTSSDAEGTSFDNSSNGMTATNVQDAIVENKTSILNNEKVINENKSKILTLHNEKVDINDARISDRLTLFSGENDVIIKKYSGLKIINVEGELRINNNIVTTQSDLMAVYKGISELEIQLLESEV